MESVLADGRSVWRRDGVDAGGKAYLCAYTNISSPRDGERMPVAGRHTCAPARRFPGHLVFRYSALRKDGRRPYPKLAGHASISTGVRSFGKRNRFLRKTWLPASLLLIKDCKRSPGRTAEFIASHKQPLAKFSHGFDETIVQYGLTNRSGGGRLARRCGG